MIRHPVSSTITARYLVITTLWYIHFSWVHLQVHLHIAARKAMTGRIQISTMAAFLAIGSLRRDPFVLTKGSYLSLHRCSPQMQLPTPCNNDPAALGVSQKCRRLGVFCSGPGNWQGSTHNSPRRNLHT